MWELAPTALFLATALTVGWSVAQVADRRAGIFATLLIFAASPRMLYIVMAPVPHSVVVYPATAALGAYLIWLARSDGRRRAATFAVPPLAGLALGVCIASDYLLVATGVVPFALTAILAGVRRERRSRLVAVSALTTAIVSVPVARLTSTGMGNLGFVTFAPSTETASLSTLPRHAELLWEGLKGLLNGYLSQTTPSGLRSDLGVACMIMMVAAFAALVIVGVRATAKFMWSGLRPREQTPTELARTLHIVYWAGSAAAVCVAFALSQRTEFVHESYYATLIFSIAAIVVLIPRSRAPARWLLSVATSVFLVASIVGLTNHYMESYVLPIARTPGYTTRPYVPFIASYESQIAAFARANDAAMGYAGYADASDLTWSSGERLLVRPVQVCGTRDAVGMCPFFLARVPAWYSPAPRRTFLLVDSTEAFLSTLPEGLGKPLAARTFGPARVYVYPYDLAARMGPPASG